ncbi:replication protein A 70 kDa DNA-binding subunit D [Artemisia annua]|uniref:Replication protein A 70 kDa DNA-binding subunit D n=1 Tax=Artemisia annua TaxID=35608 RepID=A0A2U1PQG9_ARTAN|nr:replication protein A 70 kDa DNA-binding subunit D [Artemisia annua]
MEQNTTLLCDIDPMLDDIKIVARCISIWKSHPAGKPNEVWSLDMVLQDEQGNRVQATARTKEVINKYRLLIDEGSCYRISNFGVGENGGKYPFLNHRYKISFFRNSGVTRVPSWEKNPRGFNFEPFNNFFTKDFKETDLVDVIGTIVSITDPQPFTNYGVDKIRRNVLLEDLEGKQLELCFFDEWSEKFTKYAENPVSAGHAVMILQLARVKYFNKKPSVRPALFASKVWINDKIPEIEAFRQRYVEKPGYDPKKHTITVFSPAKKIISPVDFLDGAVKKMVGTIRDSNNACHMIVYAKVHKIHRENGWAYLACKRCGCSAKEIDGTASSSSASKFKKQQTWHCKQHDEITSVGYRKVFNPEDLQLLFILVPVNQEIKKQQTIETNQHSVEPKNVPQVVQISDDEVSFEKKGTTSLSKNKEYKLIDEDTDEELGNKNIIHDFSTDEATDDIQYSNKFIGDQAEVDLHVSQPVSDEEAGIDLENSESRSDEETDDAAI